MVKVLVPLADGCEELEAVTVIDLLRRAGVEVTVAGLKPGIVRASRGVQLMPDVTLDLALQDRYDMLVLPGGMPGADHLKADPRILDLLRNMAAAGKFTAAICAAPTVLLEAGVLAGRQATGYPGFLDALNPPDVRLSTASVVVDGTVITSRGPGTAMEFALVLIDILKGAEVRTRVESALVRP